MKAIKVMGQAAGGSGGSVSITNQNITDLESGIPAAAAYYLMTDGTVENQDAIYLESWLLTGTNSDFDARVTTTGGTPGGGSGIGSWLNLGTMRLWTVTQSPIGSVNWTFDVEIRNATSLVVLDSAAISLTATRDS